MVALMGAESAGNTLDSHSSLGILPLDVDQVLVASDPQHALTDLRPLFPSRLVVGSPAVSGVAAGHSLTYRRRLYLVGGASIASVQPAQATSVFNEMVQARSTLRGGDYGILAYDSFGTAARTGPVQTEFRFERYTGLSGTPSTDAEACRKPWRSRRHDLWC